MIHSPPPCLLSYQRGLSLKADLCGGDIIPSGETAETVTYPRYPLFLTVPCTAQEPWVKFGETGLESVSQSYLCTQQDFFFLLLVAYTLEWGWGFGWGAMHGAKNQVA